MRKHFTTYRLLSNVLFLAVYCVFFTVQLFFNFNISPYSLHDAPLIISQAHQNDHSSNHHISTKNDAAKKVNTCLNKRFQPQSLPSCTVSVIIHDTEFTNTINIAHTADFIPASVPRSHSLRGPPIGC